MRTWDGAPFAARISRIVSAVTSRKSPSTTVRFGGPDVLRSAARSRSISNPITRAARAASGRVSAPRPGPISRNVSSACGATARTTFSAQADSRKCWPNRFRAGARLPVIRVAPPIALLDLLDLLFAEPEVMADFMDQRLADRHHEVLLVVRGLLVGLLEQDDSIGQRVSVVPVPFGERRALVETEERVGRFDVHLAEQRGRRVVLDDDRDVAHRVAEPLRDRGQRVRHVAFELAARHRRRDGFAPAFLRVAVRWTRTAFLVPVFLPARRSSVAAPVWKY